MTPQKRAGLGLVRSFQDARLFPTLTVLETVMIAGERTAPSGLGVAALGAHGNETVKAERARELIDLMGLGAMVDKQVGELSTGTRRMVELTCLLALDPMLLLLDEPSSGVAQAEGAALGELLRRVNKETGVSLVVIEHDLPLLSRLADRLRRDGHRPHHRRRQARRGPRPPRRRALLPRYGRRRRAALEPDSRSITRR